MCKLINLTFVFLIVLSGVLGCKSDSNAPVADNATPSANRPAAPGQSANSSAVIYSPWTSIPAWAGITNAAGYVYYQYLLTGQTRIDAAALNQGMIVAYIRFGSATGDINQIPFRRAFDRIPGRLFYENWNFRPGVGQMLIWIDPEINSYTPPTDAQVRYVIIPGDMPSGGRKAAIDYSNYDEVKKAFNIPD